MKNKSAKFLLPRGSHGVGGRLFTKMSSSSAPPESCSATAPSKCSNWDSLVVLSRLGQGQAGLNDRVIMLTLAAQIAASLCARVVPAKPCELLVAAHNVPTRSPISCHHEWSRYFDLELNLTENSRLSMLVGRQHLRPTRLHHKDHLFINGSVPKDHIRSRNPSPEEV